MKKLYHLTQSGVDELKQERDTLVSQRGLVAERIKEARELGDLSENAEYQTAREEQDRLEARIGELEHILNNLQIIKKPRSDGLVRLGSVVKLKDGGQSPQFQIVGTMEADPLNGKVSDESPIGRALLGRKQGEKVEIKAGAQTKTYKIESIS